MTVPFDEHHNKTILHNIYGAFSFTGRIVSYIMRNIVSKFCISI